MWSCRLSLKMFKTPSQTILPSALEANQLLALSVDWIFVKKNKWFKTVVFCSNSTKMQRLSSNLIKKVLWEECAHNLWGLTPSVHTGEKRETKKREGACASHFVYSLFENYLNIKWWSSSLSAQRYQGNRTRPGEFLPLSWIPKRCHTWRI